MPKRDAALEQAFQAVEREGGKQMRTGRSMRARLALLLMSGICVTDAPAAPVRTVLQQTDLSAAVGQTMRLGTVLLKAGDGPAWHSHAGVEMAYVVNGNVVLSVVGQSDRLLTAGQSLQVGRGVPHSVRAAGTADALLVANWITDSGAPIGTPQDTPPIR